MTVIDPAVSIATHQKHVVTQCVMSLSIELQINFYIFSFGVIFYFCLPNIGLQYLKLWYEIAIVATNFFDVLYEKCKKKHFNLFILLRFENDIVIPSVQFK